MSFNVNRSISTLTWCDAARFLRKPMPTINRNLSVALKPPKTSYDCIRIVAARRFFNWIPSGSAAQVGFFRCQHCSFPIVIGNQQSYDLHRSCRVWLQFYKLPNAERSDMVRQFSWKCTAFFSQKPRQSLLRNLFWTNPQPRVLPDCAKFVAAYKFFDGLDPAYAGHYSYIFCRHCGLPDLLNNPQSHIQHRRCYAWGLFMRLQQLSAA